MMPLRFLLLLFALFILSACGRHRRHVATRGMYYWKTVYNPTATEHDILKRSGVRRIYVRLFDVDREPGASGPYPVAMLRMKQRPTAGIEYVPVIFITQQALAGMSSSEAAALAVKMAGFAASLCEDVGINAREVQIDCDWTKGSRKVYFGLLQALRQQPFLAGKILSCTIRLHQVKYVSASGAPPVDRGLLMCYSMGNLKKPGTHNSILDAGEAEKYLGALETYPLKLDIALPLFSWCVLFHDGRFAGILHSATPAELPVNLAFQHKGANLYRCLADTIWHGYSVSKGDEVRAEQPSLADIREVAAYTAAGINNDSLNVVFFSADSLTLSNYTADELEEIYSAYR